MRPDIIGAHEQEPAAQIVDAPFDGGNDLLVRRSAGIDDIRGLLKTLIGYGLDQQVIVLLDDRQHVLAAGRGPAPDQRDHCGEELIEILRRGVI
jgi:hypothetical protein